MKCVFTVTDRDPSYLHMAKVLVITARLNSKEDMCCLYDGQQDEFVSWLSEWDVQCIRWHVPFSDEIKREYTGKKSIDYCSGAYLCLEVPRALRANGITDTHALFIDADTMILRDLELEDKKPTCLSAPPDWDISDWSFVSAGVMVLNLERVLHDYPSFIDHLRKHHFDFAFAGHGPCSQGAWNTFYKGSWENLAPEYDWKPWWGFNPDAKVVHFSGPKPKEIPPLLVDPVCKETERQKMHRFVVNQNPEAYRRYLQTWNKYERLIYG